MSKIWSFIRHNSGMVVGVILAVGVLVWTYGCQSQVKSITNPIVFVTRGELELEVENFIAQAKHKFLDLDRQDAFKTALFNLAIDFMQGGKINPIAVALLLGNILGLGAVGDNIRKSTHINTLKGGNANAKEKGST